METLAPTSQFGSFPRYLSIIVKYPVFFPNISEKGQFYQNQREQAKSVFLWERSSFVLSMWNGGNLGRWSAAADVSGRRRRRFGRRIARHLLRSIDFDPRTGQKFLKPGKTR